MNILVIGSGAREHAIVRALHNSKHKPNIFCFGSSNNPGILKIVMGYTTGNLKDNQSILNYAKKSLIDLAIIGPEDPLQNGLVDELEKNNIKCVGPYKEHAQIETSKGFARDLLTKYKIPACPKYKRFNKIDGVKDFLKELKEDYVIKADGLMGGKGVKVSGEHIHSHKQALEFCKEILSKKQEFVIEEKLVGQEFSLISICDGNHLVHMPVVQDHKRAYNADKGPNTGGMGSYSDSNHSLPFLNDSEIKQAQEINETTAKALKNKYIKGYKGFLYGGFMATKNGVKLIEYNARLGDPEAMNVLAILKTDFVDICQCIVNNTLDKLNVEFSRKATVCKYVVPDGYPDNPVRNKEIDISKLENQDHIYFASVDQKNNKLIELGSRTVAVVGIANTIEQAEKISQANIERIDGPLFHRSDIGTKELIQSKIIMQNNIRNNNSDERIRLVVMGSTSGTDMQTIIKAINNNELNASIELVISDKKDAYIIERAKKNNIPYKHVDIIQGDSKLTRQQYDQKVIEEIDKTSADLILLIGYMRILSAEFVNKYKNKIINVHPSLLPAFAGGMDLNVHEEVIKSGVKITGCTIHYVDETIDGGKILMQKWCDVEENDTPETLKQKVQDLEGKAFIEVINKLSASINSEEKKDVLPHDINKISRVLISVSDKQGIVEFAKQLKKYDVEIISTGNTAKTLKDNNIDVIEISEYTGFPEMMNGRLKTLHPKIHGGILGLRDKHAKEAKDNNIEWIDMVVCNLYPFSETIHKQDSTKEQAIENIDIGGPTMIRSAAKNIEHCTSVVDRDDYSKIIEQLEKHNGIPKEFREKLQAKAFSHTASYDVVIANYFNNNIFPEKLSFSFNKCYEPRYGENPHQQACVYKDETNNGCNIINAKILQGKKLSYNNINDADGALSTLKEYNEPCCVIVKHANPCGVCVADNINEAYKHAYNADSLSAFGGIIALNRTCTQEIAKQIISFFAEIVIAPDYDDGVLELFSKKDKMRVLQVKKIQRQDKKKEFKYVDGGLLYQDIDILDITEDQLKIVTDVQPSSQQIDDLLFAWKALKHVKSNAILIAKNKTTIGIGAGQVSRVDAVDIAIQKSKEKTHNAILASDAFFPFRDSIDKIAPTGIKAIIQPGGSIKDNDVIKACNEYGIAMVFTGNRCFKH